MATVTRKVFSLVGDLLVTMGRGGQVVTDHAPEGTFSDGFGALLDRVGAQFGPGGGVLLLDTAACDLLGWTEPGPLPAEGWRAAGVRGWFTYRAEDRWPVRVGRADRMDADQRVLFAASPGDTVARFEQWHHRLGVPYYGTPGTAVSSALIRMYPKGKGSPTWRVELPEEFRAVEPDIKGWAPGQAPLFDSERWTAFDRIRAGLATWTGLLVCPWTLYDSQRTTFDRSLAGMWRVTLSPWNEDRVPAPWGPRPELDGHPNAPLWVATDTLALLDDLTKEGAYGGFRVWQAKVGTAKRLTRPWAELLTRVWDTAPDVRPEADAGEAEAIRKAIKVGYRTAHGLLNNPGAGILRYDWWNAHTALSRSVAWRRMWKAAQRGFYPAFFDGDTVAYDADRVPEGVFPVRDDNDPTTDVLGRWRVSTIRNGRYVNKGADRVTR